VSVEAQLHFKISIDFLAIVCRVRKTVHHCSETKIHHGNLKIGFEETCTTIYYCPGISLHFLYYQVLW